MILDEPTSAIDSKTEAGILDALDRLMVGRTTFMIAHRLSTIHQSDWVLVMEEGRIVEQGPHHELLSRDGLYKQLNDMQSGHRIRRRGLAATGAPEEAAELQMPGLNGVSVADQPLRQPQGSAS